MKAQIAYLSKVVVAVSLSFPVLTSIAAAAPAKSAAPANSSANTNVLSALAPVEIPQSVFVISANPKECRNPFFPRSAPATPPPALKQNFANPQSFVLNGITSPPKRTAMINSSTFEQGEEHEIKLPGGSKVLVKCEEIRDDSVVIVVAGVRRELRLRSGV